MLNILKKSLLPLMLASTSAFAQPPSCPNVHVWYSLTNDSSANWAVQVSRLYENNIAFIDELCLPIILDNKVTIKPAETRYLGMVVQSAKGFYATYAFMGVNVGNPSSMNTMIPKGVPACTFVVAPFGPGQMDRVDWKTNNADCYANNLGTEMHFK